jgi:hypothetical protein
VRALHQARHTEALSPYAPQANKIKSCQDALCIVSTSRIPRPANHGNNVAVHLTPNNWVHTAGICDEGFGAVVRRTEINLAISPSIGCI